MFIYCQSCDWEQDDYWSKTYNPLRSLLDWENVLLTRELDKPFHEGMEDTVRQVLCHELKRAITRIENMQYRTPEEKRTKNPEDICPSCGNKTLEID